MKETISLEFKWTTSRGRDTYGYNVCTLYADGRKVARCNGGGYDMKGTCLGSYLESAFADRLRALKPQDMPAQSHWQPDRGRECVNCLDCEKCPVCGSDDLRQSQSGKRIDDGRYFYGLTFHDPNFDPGKAVIGKDCSDRTFGDGSEGETVAEAEAAGKSLGLERYQAIYTASEKHATERHTVPSIDGACGFSSVEQIAKAIGLSLEYVPVRSSKLDIYILHDRQPEPLKIVA